MTCLWAPRVLKLDGHVSTKEKAQRTAWRAHVASTLDDLVVSVNLLHSGHNLIPTQAYSFYSPVNYWKLIRPTFAKMIPVPQRYHVPNRIRELYKPRLETAGPWPTEAETPSGQSKLGAPLLGKPPPATDPKKIARNVFALGEVGFNHPSPPALNS